MRWSVVALTGIHTVTTSKMQGIIWGGPERSWIIHDWETDRQTDKQTDRERQTDRQMERQGDRWTGRQAERQTGRDRQTGRERQKERETDRMTDGKKNGRKSGLLQDLNPQLSALYADALPTELKSPASRQSWSRLFPYREHLFFQRAVRNCIPTAASAGPQWSSLLPQQTGWLFKSRATNLA